MMSSMGLGGLGGGKFDFKNMANHMKQNMRETKQKEAMREKLARREAERKRHAEQVAANANIKQTDDDAFVWTDENSNPSTPLKNHQKVKNLKIIRIKKRKRRLGKKKEIIIYNRYNK